MITFRLAEDLTSAAELTLTNMRSYYELYSVEWSSSDIERMTKDLSNWEILLHDEPVGIMRLSFENEVCQVRDLQVSMRYQNQGIGSRALAEAERFAMESGARILKLRVFKCSPAVDLYRRSGFGIQSEDDRFFYMERAVS